MAIFQDILDNYRAGVITAGDPGRLPREASPRGLNAYLADVGPTGASPATRRGLTTVNTTQIAASPLHHQFQYWYLSGGAYTRYHLAFCLDGKLGHLASDPGGAGTYTSISATAFTAAKPRPSTVQAANMVFMVNGTDAKKLRAGTTLETFGITRPSTGASVAAGAAGTPSGTYEVRYTFYNGNTGHESSASDTSAEVTLSSQILAVTSVDTSGDSQVTARRIYVRNTATMNQFYFAGEIANNTGTTFNWNAADTTLVETGPDTAENDPPPSGTTHLAWHRGRMFATDGTHLYYSKEGMPEAFDLDNFERVATSDGQTITALYPYEDVLLLFKSRSLYALFGVDPESWQVRLVSPDIGCTSHTSIKAADTTLFWWSEQGPVRWTGFGSKPDLIGQALLEREITPSTLAYGEFNEVVTAIDPVQQHVLFAVADLGKTRNTRVFPWSYRLNCWVSSQWDPLGGVASLATVVDDTGRPWVYYGSYAGQAFRAWDTDTDGVPSGTTSGTITASGTSTSSIAGTGFYTTGSGLVERMVSLVAADGTLMGRRYITANTATALTLDSAITGLTDGATYTFYVGGPNFEWDTKWEDSGTPFTQKRYEFAYVALDASSGDSATLHLFTNARTSSPRAHTISLTPVVSGADTITLRKPFQRVGNAWKARVLQRAPDTPLTLQAVGVKGHTLSDHVR